MEKKKKEKKSLQRNTTKCKTNDNICERLPSRIKWNQAEEERKKNEKNEAHTCKHTQTLVQ